MQKIKFKPNTLKITILKELFVVAVLGVIPVLLAYFLEGQEGLIKVIKALTANKLILYYTMATAALFYIVAYIDHRLTFLNEKCEKFHNLLSDILYEAALSLVGLLRITSGVLFAVSIFWVLAGFPSGNTGKALLMFIVGIVAFVEALVINASLNNVKEKWMRKKT